MGRISLVSLGSGGDNPYPQGLGQQQPVSGLRAALPAHLAGVYGPHDCQAEFGLVVIDSMSSGDHSASFGHLDGGATQDLADDTRRQFGREGSNAQRQDYLPAHGVDVAHGVRCGDCAIAKGIVDDRREKVGGEDQGLVVADPVNGSIVGRVESHQQVGELGLVESVAQGAQDLRQVVGRPLGRSASRCGQRGQPHVVPVNLGH